MPRDSPRQLLSISGLVPTLSSTNVDTPSISLDTTVPQTSGLTSVIQSTSALPTTTSNIVTSTPVVQTTTHTSTETTSTPETTSQRTSSVPNTTSETPTSSSPSTTPSSPPSSSPSSSSSSSSSSSIPPPVTTPAPIPSSSQQATETIVTSKITTYINGSAVVTETAIPSTIPQLSSHSANGRTAIIAGSAAGGTLLLILFLSLAFCTRRKQFKELDFLHSITLKRRQERSRANLLDGEDHDLDLTRRPPQYVDYATPWDTGGSERVLMGTATTRWSEATSALREDAWPQSAVTEGTRLMDPLANRDDLDLGRIVDDVMGPIHFSDRSVSSVHRGSVVESEGAVHSRTVSNASNAALLEAAGMGGPTGPPVSTAPVRPSPLTQSGTKPGPGSIEQPSRDVS